MLTDVRLKDEDEVAIRNIAEIVTEEIVEDVANDAERAVETESDDSGWRRRRACEAEYTYCCQRRRINIGGRTRRCTGQQRHRRRQSRGCVCETYTCRRRRDWCAS